MDQCLRKMGGLGHAPPENWALWNHFWVHIWAKMLLESPPIQFLQLMKPFEATDHEPSCLKWLPHMRKKLSWLSTILLSCIHMANISNLCDLISYFTYTEWTTEGCVTDLSEVNESVVTCNCNHLTNFAILVVSLWVCMCANGYSVCFL